MHARAPVVLALVAPLLAAALPAAVTAQEEALTLETIMAHPDWLGRAPEEAWWADDGSAVYFERKREGEELRDLYVVDADGGTPRRVEDAERRDLSVPGGDWTRDRTRKVYVREGDVYLRDVATGELRQLTRTAATESNPFFMAGEEALAYRRGDAFFVRELATGLESQPAEVLAEEDPAEAEEREEAEEGYIARAEERLFQVIRDREEEERLRHERERQLRAADPGRVPPPFYLGDDVEITGASLSPAGRWLLVTVTDAGREEGQRDLMPDYVTETGYVETHEVRPKVGTGEPPAERLLLLDLEAHERHELEWSALPGIDEDPLAELRAAAQAREEAREEARKEAAGSEDDEDDDSAREGEEDDDARGDQARRAQEERAEREVLERGEIHEPEEPRVEDEAPEEEAEEADEADEEPDLRPVRVGPMAWNDAGTRVAVMVFAADNKDRWIATVDLPVGGGDAALVPRHRLHDPAWINWSFNQMGWLPDGETLWYLSEEDGFSHLYALEVDGAGEPRRLTEGEFVVSDVTPAPDGRAFYVRSNREHPGVWEVYRVPARGGALERITRFGATVEYVLSPDGEDLLLRHSTATRPPELYVQAAEPAPAGVADSGALRLTETVSEAYAAFDWAGPELVEVPSTHGAPRPIQARLYLPRDHDPDRPEGYPVVLFIHGAGYLQDAYDGWSYYFREHMFHELLNRRGYVVLAMDYRGSAGYGRDWRTAIYRHMGGPEVEDLLDGVAWLAETHNVDPERVGIYGGSYGGFLTLMALFTEPGSFAAGASWRPVTDWAHYNHPYTANILNTPELDPEAYERSSPIEHAEGLEDPLVIIHGLQDDNVLAQDTVRLTQRLIELEKEDWWVALYPVEPHGFERPSSWLDAMRRILDLFEREVRGAE